MKPSRYVLMCLFVLLAGCGGGGGGASGSATPSAPAPVEPAPAPLPARTLVTLESDAGDLIGQGKTYSYSNADSLISVDPKGTHLVINVNGNEQWTSDFQIGGAGTELKVGTYTDLDAYVPSAGTTKPGLRWFGEGRGCSTSKGWFAVDSVHYTGAQLDGFSIRFERHCNGATPALRGTIQYSRLDQPPVHQPLTAPSDLWRPPADLATIPGNYVYLESSAGDYVGLGKSHRYSLENSDIGATGSSVLTISVDADEQWSGNFKVMSGLAVLQTGYYPGVTTYPFSNPTKGGLNWQGAGRGCVVVNGWFVVDAISYTNGLLTAVDLRFEQRCEGRAATLRGAVHWVAPAPAVPVSLATSAAGSWRPPADLGAISGNYLYFEGDPTGQPKYRSRHLHTGADAVLSVSEENGYLQIDVAGAQQWRGDVQLATKGTLLPGLYDGLKRFMNPGQPENAMGWTGQHRGCEGPRGWLAIDGVAYTAGKLSALDLRFEQVCEGAPVPMHGVLHWRAGDTATPPGPDPQAPAEAWRPALDLLPASGNYVVLESNNGDTIALGASYRYTQADAEITLSESGGHLVLKVDGDEHWFSDFQTMSSLTRLQPGYYSGLGRYPFHNPARGGFAWSGQGNACNASQSSVIVDSVAYDSGQLSAVQLRFEQHCGSGALHGAVRWAAGERTSAPGPAPIPAATWRPAAGATPASGDYVYLESDPADFIGSGKKWLHVAQDSRLTVGETGGKLSINVTSAANSFDQWNSVLVPMNSLKQLQVGFYDRLLSYPTFNPARGGFTWYGMGHGCNEALSWVAIDKANYVNGKLTVLHARFEQHCELMEPALRGEIHWGN